MRLKPLPYWPFRSKKQFYFIDYEGKQRKCIQTFFGRFISLLEVWKR